MIGEEGRQKQNWSTKFNGTFELVVGAVQFEIKTDTATLSLEGVR